MKQETLAVAEVKKAQDKIEREKWERLLALRIEQAELPPGIPAIWGDRKLYIYMPGASHPCQPDRAWPERKLLLEVQGGQWTKGRHTCGSGFETDCRKYSWYAVLGYRILFVTPAMIEDGEALRLLKLCLEDDLADMIARARAKEEEA